MNFVEPIRDLKKLAQLEAVLRSQSERNWLLFFTGLNTGLRVSDILKLRARDVRGTEIVLRETKTRKRKKAPIIPELQAAFRSYTEGFDGRVFLFRSRQGGNKPLSRSGAYKLLRKAAAEVGLQYIGTHSMRKTFGYHFYRLNKNVALLQDIFNHDSERITLRYIGVNYDEIVDALKGFQLGGASNRGASTSKPVARKSA